MTSRSMWAFTLVVVLCAAFMGASCATGSETPPAETSTDSGEQDDGSTGFNLETGDRNETSSSSQGSTAACDACKKAGGQCSGVTCKISDNPGKIDTDTQGKLRAGGSADPGFRWVYPYDQTVFPRGLTSPTLQFAGAKPTAFYVTVTFPGMNYEGFYTANSVAGFALTAADWTAITLAAGATSPVSVAVTKIDGSGQVTGPKTETWTIAPGSLKGTIYYETYGSSLVGAAGKGVGLMKIQPGASAPSVIKSGCGNACHTASADGSTLVANSGTYDNPTNKSYDQSASYDLKNSAKTIFETPRGGSGANLIFTFGGIYPDGSFVVSATGYRTYMELFEHVEDTAPLPGLYYTGKQAGTMGGAKIPAPGFDGLIKMTGTPAFSPDGKMLAYNDSGSIVYGGGHTLSVMSFDHSAFKFSNPRVIADHTTPIDHPDNTKVAWPAFTPDSKWVVYQAGSSSNYETDSTQQGDLWFTSTTSNTQTRLDALDGYSGGKVYLPANDANLSFAPTVLPEAVGGYFWVVFTSHRSYGNMLASMASLPKDPIRGTSDYDALGKLWVAAIDINAKEGHDPSHPAFYLDGQELQADNLRGFWVLSPCQADGTSCTSGDECCGGFCRPGDGGGDICTHDNGGGCSKLLESCTTASDCCDHDALCINGRCAEAPVR